MLSLDRCRNLLAKSSPANDAEIEALRDQLYLLARVVIRSFEDLHTPGVPASPSPSGAVSQPRIQKSFENVLRALPSDDLDAVQERAAMREFDGGQNRDLAERGAVMDLLQRKRKK